MLKKNFAQTAVRPLLCILLTMLLALTLSLATGIGSIALAATDFEPSDFEEQHENNSPDPTESENGTGDNKDQEDGEDPGNSYEDDENDSKEDGEEDREDEEEDEAETIEKGISEEKPGIESPSFFELPEMGNHIHALRIFIYYYDTKNGLDEDRSIRVYEDLLFTEQGIVALDFNAYGSSLFTPYKYKIEDRLMKYNGEETDQQFEYYHLYDDSEIHIYYVPADYTEDSGGTAFAKAPAAQPGSPLSLDFILDPLYPGSTVVSGAANWGDFIRIHILQKDSNDPYTKTIMVSSSSVWSQELPFMLQGGDVVTVFHQASDSDEEIPYTVEIDALEVTDLTVNTSVAGDAYLSGTGEPGAQIDVLFEILPDLEFNDATTVSETGVWQTATPATYPSGSQVTVTQTYITDVQEITVTVMGKSSMPHLDTYQEGNAALTGSGVSGAVITVNYPGGGTQSAAVSGNGAWSVAIPETLKPGTATVRQQEEGKIISDAVTVNVAPGASHTPSSLIPFEKTADDSGVSVPAIKKTAFTFICADLEGNILLEENEKLMVGTTIKMSAPDFSGYTLADERTKTLTVGGKQNEIRFLYEPEGDAADSGNPAKPEEAGPIALPKADIPAKPDQAVSKGEAVQMLLNLGNDLDGNGMDPQFTVMLNYFNSAANGALTRSELVVFLAAYQSIQAKESYGFTDVGPDHWASGYIGAAQDLGWVVGYGDGAFRPDAAISRAEAVIIFNRAFSVPPVAADSFVNPFADIAADHWAYGEFLSAAAGILG